MIDRLNEALLNLNKDIKVKITPTNGCHCSYSEQRSGRCCNSLEMFEFSLRIYNDLDGDFFKKLYEDIDHTKFTGYRWNRLYSRYYDFKDDTKVYDNAKYVFCFELLETDSLPIKEWKIEWFEGVTNAELRRRFIKEHGLSTVAKYLNFETVSRNQEYKLVKFRYGDSRNEEYQKALIYQCPSSNDTYFTQVDPWAITIDDAVKFLNNNISKEELAFES